MTAPSLRQSVTSLTARLGKQGQTLSAQQACRRSGAFHPEYYNKTLVASCRGGSRGLWTTSRTAVVAPSSLRYNSFGSKQQQQQHAVRWNSGKGEQPWTQWGFEDINASLPSDSPGTSPSQTPQKNLILVDVREPAELTSTGIIPSAVAVPLASQPDALFLTPEEFETRFGFPKPGASAEEQSSDVVFYCKAGVRARAAAQLALQAGYDPERVGVYDGSWLDWARKGGKAEKWEGEDYE